MATMLVFHYQLMKPLSSISYAYRQPSPPPRGTTCKACLLTSKNASARAVADVDRRSANYPATIWDFNFVQSLKSDHGGMEEKEKIMELEKSVRRLFEGAVEPLDKVELIDVLQRLGLGYHFEEEIREILTSVSQVICNNTCTEESLYVTALGFRLLRQNGFFVPQGVFSRYRDELGRWDQIHVKDVKGLLSLYEACHLNIEGDALLDEAKIFTTLHLKNLYLSGGIEPFLAKQVERALEVPLHWRVPTLEARWYTEAYRSQQAVGSELLELARLDYNMNQAIYQSNVQTASRWWKKTGLGDKLSFSRDRVVECFVWTIGVAFQPEYGSFREELTKVNSLVTVFDDIYDVYGTLEELKLFTEVIHRWDLSAMEQLPDYMRLCYLALFNTVNEWAYQALKDHGLDILPYLRKMWADLCESYMVEAQWYSMGYTPTLEEYINNAWISIAGPVALVHGYILLGQGLKKETLDYLIRYPDLIRYSSMIFRLADDLATSTEELARGDVPKSIQCYMKEKGVSEEVARLHIKDLISDSWKRMNKVLDGGTPLPRQFVDAVFNFARISQSMYHNGDGFVGSSGTTKDKIVSLLVEPISIH